MSVKMTEMDIYTSKTAEETSPLKTSEDFTEHQRTDEGQREEELVREQNVEEIFSYASLEPSTLQWPEDRGRTSSAAEERESSQEQVSRTESADVLDGESDEDRDNPPYAGDGSLADDEQEEDDDDKFEDEKLQATLLPEKAAQAFTPRVMIVQLTGNQEDLNESSVIREEIEVKVPLCVQNFHVSQPEPFHPQWITEIEKSKESRCCGQILRLCIFISAAAVVFPLLTWAGYEFLPFSTPPLDSTPLRLVYTLRCAFFATIPIVLGLLVQGMSWLRFGALKPLYEGTWENRKVAVHSHYVRDSLHLYLLYFLQLAVMATYVQPEMVKLVPLLSIIFVFGRLIYWVCAVFGSSARALGFGLSFFPLLVLLAANVYFVFSASRQEAVFLVAPPTTAPPPKQRWWG